MANEAPKRKRLEKTVVDAPVSTQKFYCCRCGTAYSRQKGYFPVSHSPMYRGSGYLPWCNDCVDDMYNRYKLTLGSDREALKRICMKMDLYWHESIYEMVEKTSGVQSRVRAYIGKTNINRFIDKTFDNTIAEELEQGIEWRRASQQEVIDALARQRAVEESSALEDISPETIAFWGSGYTADFYEELERRYQDWTGELGQLDPAERALYKQICLLEVTITRDSSAGKAIDKNINALNTLLGSANLKPAQKKAEDGESNLDAVPLGVWIRRYENTRPIPEPDPEFEDKDGIIRYIETWFKGHLAKMVGIKNGYSKIYEDEIARMRVERPEFDDVDDETMFNDIFSDHSDEE